MNKKCLIIINKLSGNSEKINVDMLKAVLCRDFQIELKHITEKELLGDLSAFDRIVACGGDGTLNGVLNSNLSQNVELIYLPYGTLNELSASTVNATRHDCFVKEVCKLGDHTFSYVFATGTFTPLGYNVLDKKKKRYKFWAYLQNVIKEYKIYSIQAQLQFGEEVINDTYTLIMLINSSQCFGFRFNKLYQKDDGILHLLTIKSPKYRGLLGAVSIFFPFFRAFFIGFKKEYKSQRMLFVPIKNAIITLNTKTTFNADGERTEVFGENPVRVVTVGYSLRIVTHSQLSEYYANSIYI